jgi:galactose mutarotase-like enzyme
MLDAEQLKSVASQLMTRGYVDVEGQSAPVRRISRQRLKTAAFCIDGHQYQAIEQNPEKPSRWGQLARSGRQVVQIKDAEKNRFVAVVVDGEVTYYGHSNKRS